MKLENTSKHFPKGREPFLSVETRRDLPTLADYLNADPLAAYLDARRLA